MKVLRPVWPRLVFAALAVIIGVCIWRFGHIGIVPAFAISLCALLANGLLATLEDDLPGGFNNADGSATPRYARIVARVTHFAFPVFCFLLAAFLFLSASDVGFITARGLALACLGLASVCAYIAVRTQRRVALAALIALIAVALFVAWAGRGF
jgi:hypothetical protein